MSLSRHRKYQLAHIVDLQKFSTESEFVRINNIGIRNKRRIHQKVK